MYALVAAGANLVGGLVITTASPRGRLTQRLLIGLGAGFMLAVALGQALIALSAQSWVGIGWLVGSIVFVVVTALNPVVALSGAIW